MPFVCGMQPVHMKGFFWWFKVTEHRAQVRHRLVISIKVFFVRLQAISCNHITSHYSYFWIGGLFFINYTMLHRLYRPVGMPFIFADTIQLYLGRGDFVLPVLFFGGDSVQGGFCPFPDSSRSTAAAAAAVAATAIGTTIGIRSSVVNIHTSYTDLIYSSFAIRSLR